MLQFRKRHLLISFMFFLISQFSITALAQNDEQMSEEAEEAVEEVKVEGSVVTIPVTEQDDNSDIERPLGGMSKEEVKNHWGEPDSVREAVGSPPISSWVYKDFTVYFEGDTVLHSVMKPKNQ